MFAIAVIHTKDVCPSVEKVNNLFRIGGSCKKTLF